MTAMRKKIVLETRPWEKTPRYMKAQEKAQKAIAQQERVSKAKA
jgi:hypothetical protein